MRDELGSQRWPTEFEGVYFEENGGLRMFVILVLVVAVVMAAIVRTLMLVAAVATVLIVVVCAAVVLTVAAAAAGGRLEGGESTFLLSLRGLTWSSLLPLALCCAHSTLLYDWLPSPLYAGADDVRKGLDCHLQSGESVRAGFVSITSIWHAAIFIGDS